MEDAQDVHRARSRVLDAVHLVGRQMEARSRLERERATTDVGNSLSRDDAADLVVGVAVKGRLARLNDSQKLRHVEAAGVLVDEISEAPLDGGLELRLVVEADRHLALA